jgi:hypothetical protein
LECKQKKEDTYILLYKTTDRKDLPPSVENFF